LAHEQHAKEMMIQQEHKRKFSLSPHNDYEYWRGRLEALQALKGEVKK